MITMTPSLVTNLPLLFLLLQNTPQAYAVDIRKPHSTVQTLTEDNFDLALNDPANGLWLLKFYAPWCSHCKKLAPTLDLMAPYLEGKIAIGKIDCTDTKCKPICDEHKVKGYPTLKVFRDGDFFDYPGKRDADSMIEFAEKMSMPAVKIVQSYEEALSEIVVEKDKVSNKSDGSVGFIAYDANALKIEDISDGIDDEKKLEKVLASTTGLQVFGQVARKLQADGKFGLLDPVVSPLELEKFGVANSDSGLVLMKVEVDVDTLLYEGPISSLEFMDFVKVNNVPLITKLGGRNFRAIGAKGKPLAIAVVNSEDIPTERDSSFMGEVREYAKNGSSRTDYYFCQMDGNKWKVFLKQFSISIENLPEVFMLDVPTRMYWYNESISKTFVEFMKAVGDGKIEAKKQQTPGGKSILDDLHEMFVTHLPLCLFFVFLLVCFMIYLSLGIPDEEEELKATSLKLREQKVKKSQKED